LASNVVIVQVVLRHLYEFTISSLHSIRFTLVLSHTSIISNLINLLSW